MSNHAHAAPRAIDHTDTKSSSRTPRTSLVFKVTKAWASPDALTNSTVQPIRFIEVDDRPRATVSRGNPGLALIHFRKSPCVQSLYRTVRRALLRRFPFGTQSSCFIFDHSCALPCSRIFINVLVAFKHCPIQRVNFIKLDLLFR